MAQYTFKFFDSDEDILRGKPKTKTFPIWSDDPSDVDTNPESTLTAFYTASWETGSWEGNYFYNIYSTDTTTNYNLQPQFSIAIGSTASYALYDDDDEDRYVYPSKAIYRQFINILTDGSSATYFTDPDGNVIPVIYVISVSRDRIKDGIEPTTWKLTLSGSSTTVDLIAGTGSTEDDNEYDIYESGSANFMGTFYSDQGVFILDANKLYVSGAFQNDPVACFALTGSGESAGYTPEIGLKNFYYSLSNGEYFKARTTEKVQSTHYFIRVKNYEFNYSSNPTWVTGSDNEILDEFYEEPKTFITSVGLYDGAGEAGRCVAVAKLSRPLMKSEDTEALVKVRLDF